MIDLSTLMEKYRDQLPIPIFEIISELGMGPAFEPLDDDVSGWIERTAPDEYRIVINERHAPTRKRFTAAHELGHYIYHRDLLGAGTGDTRAYRAEQSPLPNALIRPRHERQANTFAANLLMPAAVVQNLRNQGVQDARDMAEKLGVSVEAMRIRLGSTS